MTQTIGKDTVLCEVALADDTRAESIDLRVDDDKWPWASARNGPGVYFEFFSYILSFFVLFDPLFLVSLKKIKHRVLVE